ncbi:gag-pol polyprotein [Cucumis melo var. makuwa]|uniref:Gag-pol polyprotein n=1 Tax=Cucumis melo var. makuwa TaxID=1194695 RepID=A0A5A7V9V9_CUCMM|nr:gag-pol polyprotein [Cucumis melo var. makuwa]TYK01199.1 gag-pol polyprotein [Cucumis melo var. makuwa]
MLTSFAIRRWATYFHHGKSLGEPLTRRLGFGRLSSMTGLKRGRQNIRILTYTTVCSSPDVGIIGRTRAGCKIMKIIREGPSASCPPVLDDGRAWRALVAGYEPSMITVDGLSIPKLEVDWTNAEEQASVGNARALNAIFNGVDLNVFKLINSCSTTKEA